MSTEHNVITDPEIHEPKGVAAATINQVYVADGAGSGAWDIAPGAASNTIDIEAKSDFPTPSGGVITLLANTIYHLHGNIDLGTDRLVLALQTVMLGTNAFVDGITYTGTSPLLTATTSFAFRNLNVTCVNSDIVSLTGTNSGESANFANSFVIQCKAGGVITSFTTLNFRSFSIIKSTVNGISFAGANGSLSMSDSVFVQFTAGIMIDYGSATFDRIQMLSGNRFTTSSGVTGMSGLASSGNINTGGFGILHGNVFEGAGTLLNNITISDEQWQLDNNGGVGDSVKAATGSTKGQAATTSTSTTPVKVNIGTSFIADIERQFTVDNTGKITYFGKGPQAFQVDATILFDIGSGTNQPYFFYVAKNGSVIQASVGEQQFDSTDPIQVTINGVVELSATDFVEIYVEKGSSTGTDNARTMNIVVR